MAPSWKQEILNIHERALSRKRRFAPWTIEDLRFLALAIAGEAGELANRVKKEWRGDDNVENPIIDPAVHAEIVDIRVYCELLAHLCQFDLDAGVERKLPEIRRKFEQIGEKPADWDKRQGR